jgi:hypothetical protein
VFWCTGSLPTPESFNVGVDTARDIRTLKEHQNFRNRCDTCGRHSTLVRSTVFQPEPGLDVLQFSRSPKQPLIIMSADACTWKEPKCVNCRDDI